MTIMIVIEIQSCVCNNIAKRKHKLRLLFPRYPVVLRNFLGHFD